MTIGPTNTQSAFLSPEVQFSSDPKLMSELLSKRERITATCLNIREIAQYELTEIFTGQQYFSTTPVNLSSQKRGVYRLTFDLVALNGGAPIPVGPKGFALTPTTIPAKIDIPNGLIPTHGYGACTAAANYLFINDPLVFVRFGIWSNASQTIGIQNNSGSPLTQCYFVFEYIKT